MNTSTVSLPYSSLSFTWNGETGKERRFKNQSKSENTIQQKVRKLQKLTLSVTSVLFLFRAYSIRRNRMTTNQLMWRIHEISWSTSTKFIYAMVHTTLSKEPWSIVCHIQIKEGSNRICSLSLLLIIWASNYIRSWKEREITSSWCSRESFTKFTA